MIFQVGHRVAISFPEIRKVILESEGIYSEVNSKMSTRAMLEQEWCWRIPKEVNTRGTIPAIIIKPRMGMGEHGEYEYDVAIDPSASDDPNLGTKINTVSGIPASCLTLYEDQAWEPSHIIYPVSPEVNHKTYSIT